MYKKIYFFLSILLFTKYAYPQNTWTNIFEGPMVQVSLLNGSFLQGKTYNNKDYFLIKIKIIDKRKNTVLLQKAVVYAEYCKVGEGKLELYDLDEKNLTKHEFIIGAGNLASGVGEVICNLSKSN